MRPRMEVRLALQVAAAEKPGNVRDLARRAGVGLQAAGRTIDNMVRASELAPVGKEWVAWRRSPVRVYGIPTPGAAPEAKADPGAALQTRLLNSWR